MSSSRDLIWRSLSLLLVSSLALACGSGGPPPEPDYDVVVYGGTSAGVSAAVQAARMGKSVVLVGPDQHLGGLSAGGVAAAWAAVTAAGDGAALREPDLNACHRRTRDLDLLLELADAAPIGRAEGRAPRDGALERAHHVDVARRAVGCIAGADAFEFGRTDELVADQVG